MSPWQIACLARELKGAKPLGVTLEGRHIALFRRSDGRPAALEDRCAHRNAPLSLGRVRHGKLVCRYHGWAYDGCGAIDRIPSLGAGHGCAERIRDFPAVEQDGFIWIALAAQAPQAAPERFAHFGERGWSSFVMKTRFRAPVEACLENFLDCPHATYLHRYWFRSPTSRRVRARVSTLHDGAQAEFFEEPRERSLVWWLLAPRRGAMRHVDRFIAPRTSRVDYEFENGAHYVITSSCSALAEDETDVYTVISFRYGRIAPLLRPFFERLARRIIRQDAEMLDAQYRNVRRFGRACFTSTPADLLGGEIVGWRRALARNEAPPPAGREHHVDIVL